MLLRHQGSRLHALRPSFGQVVEAYENRHIPLWQRVNAARRTEHAWTTNGGAVMPVGGAYRPLDQCFLTPRLAR